MTATQHALLPLHARGLQVQAYDIRQLDAGSVASCSASTDEVSCLAVHKQGTLVAAADDSGEAGGCTLKAASSARGADPAAAPARNATGRVAQPAEGARPGAGQPGAACAGGAGHLPGEPTTLWVPARTHSAWLWVPARCAGDVQLLEWSAGQLKTQRRLPGAHDTICSAVAFRQHRPYELLTSGFDCKLK
jgi:hypothetical protein